MGLLGKNKQKNEDALGTQEVAAPDRISERREQDEWELMYDTIRTVLGYVQNKKGKNVNLMEYITTGKCLDSTTGLCAQFDTTRLKGFLHLQYNGMQLSEYDETNLQKWFLLIYKKYLLDQEQLRLERRRAWVGDPLNDENPDTQDYSIVGLEDEPVDGDNLEV